MTDKPKVSIVMSVFNAEQFLSEAIESVLKQTFDDFEFIIINDGCTDGSLEIINSFELTDKRIILINRENKGLIASLNEGVSMARGEYIARMDADDISLPLRLQKQVDYLSSHPEIDVIGCDYAHIDSYGQLKKVVHVPKSAHEILLTMFFTVPFAHPSVMGRRVVFKKVKYEESAVEDYLLWTRLFNGSNFSNINIVLLHYRHDYGHSFSDTKRISMMESEAHVSSLFIANHLKTAMQINSAGVSNKLLGRAIATTLLNYSTAKGVKLLSKDSSATMHTVFFLVRHVIRAIYWRYKSG